MHAEPRRCKTCGGHFFAQNPGQAPVRAMPCTAPVGPTRSVGRGLRLALARDLFLENQRLTVDYANMLTRRLFCLSLPSFAAACAQSGLDPSARTTVIMVRHADRAGDILNDKGIARAAALPDALVAYDIDGIYSPDIPRNLDTARPLSEATGLPVSITPKEFAAAEMTSNHPNGTVVWVGNKGNLRDIWAELGAPGPAPQEYGEIGVIELQGGGVPVVTRLIVEP